MNCTGRTSIGPRHVTQNSLAEQGSHGIGGGAPSLISIKSGLAKKPIGSRWRGVEGRVTSVSDIGKKNHTVRSGRDAISAVQLSQGLTAEIDAWAEAHHISRSDAIGRLRGP